MSPRVPKSYNALHEESSQNKDRRRLSKELTGSFFYFNSTDYCAVPEDGDDQKANANQ